ncbi:MAG: tRNA (N(6)-L-threonylcarbamoyladenosine(37)-C(2))-methylthiotransferase MtaB [Nitrospirota bacterium]
MKINIKSLGCKINQFDANHLKESLSGMGAEVSDGPGADVQVIFTCTVTGKSDQQCRAEIRRAVREKRGGGLVVVAGCYAETNPEAIMEIPGVDIVVGNDKKESIAGMILPDKTPACNSEARSVAPGGAQAQAVGGRSRAFLKAQEGCDSFCSYCIVPYARGRSRSARLDDVIENADRLIEKGYFEIVLTGVHLGLYGRDLAGSPRISGLVERLLERPGLGRLRLSSIEPMELDEGLIGLIGSPKLCRHFHLPLQSGCDRVLESMGRGYTAEEYFRTISRIHDAAPGACIGADVIVGYPVEDDKGFDDTFRLVQDSPINYLHVFPYSPRPGTRAYSLGDPVRVDVKRERSLRLRELGRLKRLKFMQDFVGSTITVVAEDKSGVYSGLSDNYIRVRFDGAGLKPGAPAALRIDEVTDGHCNGRLA